MPHFLRFVTLAALTFLLTRYISLEQVAFTYAGASLVVVGVGILYLWQMYHAHFNLSGHGEKPEFIKAGIQPSMRSEEHTSELQSLMRISYAVFSLKKKNLHTTQTNIL